MVKPITDYRRVQSICSKGHLLPSVVLSSGDQVTQYCSHCGERVTSRAEMGTQGFLIVRAERQKASA